MICKPVFRLALMIALGSGIASAQAARVVATITPIHSLVASVTADVDEPELLLPPGASPHSYALRPSGIRRLREADMVVSVGAGLERFLDKTLQSLPPPVRHIVLADTPEITLLRAPGRHRNHDVDHANDQSIDPHIWLDPVNAKLIVTYLAGELSRSDPANATRYRENKTETLTRLDALDLSVRQQLAGVADRPYLVFHDAYRYFETRYGLRHTGAFTIDPVRLTSARRVHEMHEQLDATGARCIFSEPQFRPALLRTVAADTGVAIGVLDPIGADIEPGPDAYFLLIERMARALSECLTQ